MLNFKKIFSIILATALIIAMGVQAFAVEIDKDSDISSEETGAIGYSVTDENGVTKYYINGKQIFARSGVLVKESEYEGYIVKHDSWKEYDWENDEPLTGHSTTSMEHKDTGDYRHHYTRVKINSGSGESSDSGRVWTYGFMAKAHTNGVKYTAFNTLRSWWGVDD